MSYLGVRCGFSGLTMLHVSIFFLLMSEERHLAGGLIKGCERGFFYAKPRPLPEQNHALPASNCSALDRRRVSCVREMKGSLGVRPVPAAISIGGLLLGPLLPNLTPPRGPPPPHSPPPSIRSAESGHGSWTALGF